MTLGGEEHLNVLRGSIKNGRKIIGRHVAKLISAKVRDLDDAIM